MMLMPHRGACRALGTCVALVVALLAAAAPRASAQRATLEKMIRDTVLANGLHVIVVRNSSVPLATIEVVVRTGAFSQLTPEDEGVPHLLEHMLFKSGDGTMAGSFEDAAFKVEALTHNGVTEP